MKIKVNNNYWKLWNKWHEYPSNTINDIVNFLIHNVSTISENNSINILDFGTGTGIISSALSDKLSKSINNINSKKNINILGYENQNIDFHEIKECFINNSFRYKKSYKFEHKQNKNCNYNLKFGDILNSLEPHQKFDIFIMIDFIHYLPIKNSVFINQFVRFIDNHMKNDGYILLGIPNGDIKYLVGDFNKRLPETLNEFQNFFKKDIFNLPANYVYPTEKKRILEILLNNNFVIKAKLSTFWKKTVINKDIIELYKQKALSICRITQEEIKLNLESKIDENIEKKFMFSENLYLIKKQLPQCDK